MLNVVRMDFYKIKKLTSIKVLFLFVCICAGIITVSMYLKAQGNLGSDICGQLSVFSDIVMRGFIGAILAGNLICSEFDNKILSSAVTSGYTRNQIALGKMISFTVVTAIVLSPYAIAVLIGVLSGADFGEPFVASAYLGILSHFSTHALTASGFLKMILLLLIQMLIYASQLSLCALLAVCLKKIVPTIAAGYFLIAAGDFLCAVLGDKAGIKELVKCLPFSQGFQVLKMGAGTGTLIKSILSGIIFLVVVTILICRAFQKAELK